MKARLPQNGGGTASMQQLAQQAQKLQEQMEAITDELDVKEYTESSGGGAVTVTVTGKNSIVKIDVKPEVVDPDDIEMLTDMIMAAANEALRKAAEEREERMSALSGGLNLPGLF
ncbi:MAG: YbaB/EbfC family nucleoid-associated protein [Ruminococcaceae bacterium]|nr:YbaB/EbfC family nucleoid-associated protein [Oscillospiraceae bacterium]